MSKQVLDVQQMQHLQEVGLELKETMLYWVVYEVGNENNFVTTKENAMEVIDESCGMLPAYTLQDVLDIFPKRIEHNELGYYLETGAELAKGWYIMYHTSISDTWKYIEGKEFIDIAYEMLLWCIENKFVETNKNELNINSNKTKKIWKKNIVN